MKWSATEPTMRGIGMRNWGLLINLPRVHRCRESPEVKTHGAAAGGDVRRNRVTSGRTLNRTRIT